MVFFMGGQDGPSTMPPAGGTTGTSTGYLQQLAAQYGIPAAGAGGPAAAALIYLGRGADPNKAPAAVRRGIFDAPAGSYGDKTGKRDDLLGDLLIMKKEKQRELALWLVLGGYTGGPQFTPSNGATVPVDKAAEYAADMSQAEVLNAYDALLSDAENLYGMGQKVTPMQVLRKAIAFRLPGSVKWDGKLGSLNSALDKAGINISIGDESQAGTFTTTSKSKSMDFMDPMDAKALARGVLQQELGRDPTQAEYEDFLAAIHAAEAHNPNVTTTSTTYTLDDEGRQTDSNTSSTTHAGITGAGLAQMATEKAQANPNWAEWQAMGTYAPALFAALGSTVPGA